MGWMKHVPRRVLWRVRDVADRAVDTVCAVRAAAGAELGRRAEAEYRSVQGRQTAAQRAYEEAQRAAREYLVECHPEAMQPPDTSERRNRMANTLGGIALAEWRRSRAS